MQLPTFRDWPTARILALPALDAAAYLGSSAKTCIFYHFATVPRLAHRLHTTSCRSGGNDFTGGNPAL